jgi:hypothetical protein
MQRCSRCGGILLSDVLDELGTPCTRGIASSVGIGSTLSSFIIKQSQTFLIRLPRHRQPSSVAASQSLEASAFRKDTLIANHFAKVLLRRGLAFPATSIQLTFGEKGVS